MKYGVKRKGETDYLLSLKLLIAASYITMRRLLYIIYIDLRFFMRC